MEKVRITTRGQFSRLIERRALMADVGVGGGYLLTERMLDELIAQERNASVMRAICRILNPLGEGEDQVGVPSHEAAMSDATWTNELGTGSEDITASFGKRTLKPYPLTKRVRVSRTLLRSQANAEAWILEAIADAIATPQEIAFIQGSGRGEPLGLLNTDGLPVYTTSGSGTVTGDDIRKWIFSLPARFLGRAKILTSVDFMRHVLTLKDSAGNYLFPDYRGRLLNVPVVLTDGLPDIVDASDNLIAGEYAAVIGDFRWYWIVDNGAVEILRLEELYAEENEVGFQVRQETDGMAVLPAAFYALKIKA